MEGTYRRTGPQCSKYHWNASYRSRESKNHPDCKNQETKKNGSLDYWYFCSPGPHWINFHTWISKLFAQKQANIQAPIVDAPTTIPTTEESVVFPTITTQPASPVLGGEENPIIFMYVPSEFIVFNEISLAVDEFAADFTAKNPDLHMNIVPAPDMKTVVDAICANEAHVAALNSISYLVASGKGCAEVNLLWSAHEDIK